jgi:hypothetical protein
LPFLFSQPEGRLGGFIARIPRYTHSYELLRDLQLEVQQQFNPRWTECVPTFDLPDEDDEHEPPEPRLADTTLYRRLAETLAPAPGREQVWSANREISEATLPPELDTRLRQSGTALALGFRLQDGEGGVLLLGRRPQVYNLPEVEALSRLTRQAQLALDVLRLLENEKVLLEKTYEASMTALRSQINPHFLFNTLNTISALIHDNPRQAEAAVEKLAFIFRHTLKFSAQNLVPLRTELELVRSYLDIEQMRFGKRLRVSINVEPDALEVPIPAVMLQTFVENCIKHGISKVVRDGEVRIEAQVQADVLHLLVLDNGPGIDTSRIRRSTGLSNVLTRLGRIYGTEEVIRFSNTGNGTCVELNLPVRVL